MSAAVPVTVVTTSTLVFVQNITAGEHLRNLKVELANASHKDKPLLLAKIDEAKSVPEDTLIVPLPVQYQARHTNQKLPKNIHIVGWLDKGGFRKLSSWGPDVDPQWLGQQSEGSDEWAEALERTSMQD